jgi:amino acid transporter
MSNESATKNAGDAALFLRKATGLVRSWSVFDAFIYAFFSINLVTLGLYSISQMYFFDGGMLNGLVIFGVLILAEVVVYAALIAVMPRAGGDYVWQSRILGGGVGFVLAVTGWWFILWLWTPLYGDMLRKMIVVPILALLGQRDSALWVNSDTTAFFAASLITLAFVTVVIIVGMKRYATFQKWSFWIGNAGLLMVIGLLFSGDHEAFKAAFESNSTALFGTAAGLYDATVAAGDAAGAVNPLMGGDFKSISLLLPWVAFFLLYPNWGATLYGEVKGADDFKRNFTGMATAVIATVGLLVLLFFAIDHSITWKFYMQANGAYWNTAWGYTTDPSPFPIWPYPALLAAFMTTNPIVQILVIVAMSMWFFGWAGTMFLSSTRVIFAAAFDRLLPEAAAQVDEKTRTPVWALVLMVVPGIIVSYLYCYNLWSFASLTLAATLVIGITFFGTAIAATILPYTKKDLYEASPIAGYKVLGIPLITVFGAITSVFLGFLLYQWLLDPEAKYGIGYSINDAGVKNTTSLYFMGALYGVALLIYVGMRMYRKSKGVNLDVLYSEIPAE